MRNHKPLIAFFVILCIPTSSFSQPSNHLANMLFPSDSQVLLSKFKPLTVPELEVIQKQIELPGNAGCMPLIKATIDDNEMYKLLSGFKKYDISGDGTDDLIFSSPCASDEMQTHFWVKKGKRYYHSVLIVGSIEKLYKANDMQALSIVSRSDWCCVPYVGSINLFMPVLADGKLTYKLKKRIKEFVSLLVPEKRTIEKSFVVTNDQYNLRDSPVINDNYDAAASEFERTEVYGNTLAKFVKGSKGTAIAEKVDNTGRIWWFVIMDEDARTHYNRFYSDENASKMGWMSSRFLEVIK